VGHGEAGIEPLAQGAARPAELGRDEDVEQSFGFHLVEALDAEAALRVGGRGAGLEGVEQLGRWHRAARGRDDRRPVDVRRAGRVGHVHG
jgi:hypothetical protein